VEVIGTLRSWLRTRREKRLDRIALKYGDMSADARFDLDRLREEHSGGGPV